MRQHAAVPFKPGTVVAVTGANARTVRKFIEGYLRADPKNTYAYDLEPLAKPPISPGLARQLWRLRADIVSDLREHFPERVTLLQHKRGDARAMDASHALEVLSPTEADVVRLDDAAAWNQRIRITDAGVVLETLQ